MTGDIRDITGPEIIGPTPESPIAERMEHVLMLHLVPSLTIRREYPCPTPWANFRIDLVVANGKRLIGIECDGKEFHDQFRDETRDSMILGMELVDTIWRFRGVDINFAIHDCLYIMAKVEADLFTDRGKKVLWSQACDSVRDFEDKERSFIFMSRRNDQLGAESLGSRKIEIVRNSRINNGKGSPFWKSIFEQVKSQQHLTFDQVVADQREKLRNAF